MKFPNEMLMLRFTMVAILLITNESVFANKELCYQSSDRKMKMLEDENIKCTIDMEDDISNPDRIMECSRVNNCQ